MRELKLSGEVGGPDFNIRKVEGLPPGPLRVLINSPGGCLISGIAIYQALRDHPGPVTTEIERASSAAILPALAGDIRKIWRDGTMVIHNCWSCVIGTADEHVRAAELMRQQDELRSTLVAERTGLDIARVNELAAAETTLTASQALHLQFATEIMGDQPEPVPPPHSPLGTAAACLAAQNLMREPEHTTLRKAAWPSLATVPGAEAALTAPAIPAPEISNEQAGAALELFCEAERRQVAMRRQVASRLQSLRNQGGKISWPIRITWTCSHCSATNHSPPIRNRLATPCTKCGAHTLEEHL